MKTIKLRKVGTSKVLTVPTPLINDPHVKDQYRPTINDEYCVKISLDGVITFTPIEQLQEE